MKAALDKGKDLPPNKMAYSAKMFVLLRRFMPLFEHSIILHRQSLASQNKKSREYNDVIKKARVYLTHFIRVMNMSVYRGDLIPETRAYYGLATNESTLPSLNTENELISWGRRIIDGEEMRIRKGASPITNPTIAVVKVRYEKFLEAYNFHRTLIKKTLDYSERAGEMRKEADEIILRLWNEIEEFFSRLPEEERKKECEKYGLVYFYRKNEIVKSLVPEPRVASFHLTAS